MSTLSPIFGFVLATTADTVNVVTQIAGNFSSLDSVIGVAHTGTGQLKSGMTIQSPTVVSPTLVGTMTGSVVAVSTGKFNTVTATGGAIIVDSLAVGTYSYPATIGSTGQLLTVSADNAVWIDNVPNTGAGVKLDNLDAVAINTSLNNFTAGTVVVNSIKATAGTLSGLTSVVSTTGTFSGLNIVGTMNADAINFTGGTVKVASFSVGTYTYPNALGSTGQVFGYVGATTAGFTWNTRGSLLFSAIGCPYGIASATTAGGGSTGWGFSTFFNWTGNALGGPAGWFSATSAAQTIMDGKLEKKVGIDTVTCWVYGNMRAAGITGTAKVIVGTVTSSVILITGSTRTWYSADLDISPHANTVLDLSVSINPKEEMDVLHLWGVEVFAKTGSG